MGEILKLGFVLMAVSLVAAVALGLANRTTAPVIAELEAQAKLNAMIVVSQTLAPEDSIMFDSLSVPGLSNPYALVDKELAVFSVRNENGQNLGYVFVAYGKGYSSVIQTMVATDLSGVITGTMILSQQETPGLGANVVKPDKLTGHFTGLRATGILLKKDGGGIDAITASTITSRAVTNSIRTGLEAMSEADMFGNGQGGVL